jgi:hypothetical protein
MYKELAKFCGFNLQCALPKTPSQWENSAWLSLPVLSGSEIPEQGISAMLSALKQLFY